MAEAYVIDAVRTPVGKKNGSLSAVHPIDLGVYAFRGLFDRVNVEEGLTHFRNKIEPALAEGNTFPAEVYVNILLRLGRKSQALEAAKRYLADVGRQTVCPSVYELCQDAGDFAGLAEAAQKRADGVNFLAGLIKARA